MNAVTKAEPRSVQPVLVPTTFDQLVIFADMAASSGMVPKDYANKPGAIMVAVQMGSELGLSPMQSLNSIAVINGRPGIWGDGLIGLCRQSPLCQDIVETLSGEGDDREAVCVATRRGSTPVTGRFSVRDAKRAGLWGKDIWSKYPDRMLVNRARGFALRDAFPDVLRGLKTAEELLDTPPDTFRGATLDARPEPRPQPEPQQSSIAPENPGASADRHPKAEVFDARDRLNAEVPMTPPAPPRKTARQWLDDLRIRVAQCQTAEELDHIATSEEVRKAQQHLRNGALDELNAIFADAMERLADAGEIPPEPEPQLETADADDTFPADRP
jgi:hypothetical protein